MTKRRLILPMLMIVNLIGGKLFAAQVCLQEQSFSTVPKERYIANSNGTVTDSITRLTWRICLEGQSGEACTGNALELSWAEALLYPQRLNQGQNAQQAWRLPNIRELNTLVELRCAQPALNREVFKGVVAQHIWTSSPYHFYTHYAWYMDFASGVATYDERVKKKALLLVQDQQ